MLCVPSKTTMDKVCGFYVFGGCEIYKPEQVCMYTDDENKGVSRGE